MARLGDGARHSAAVLCCVLDPLLLCRMQTDRLARNVIIVVTDTGCGIPQHLMRQLLVPFKQVRH